MTITLGEAAFQYVCPKCGAKRGYRCTPVGLTNTHPERLDVALAAAVAGGRAVNPTFLDTIDVSCLTCGARPGVPCRGEVGKVGSFHSARIVEATETNALMVKAQSYGGPKLGDPYEARLRTVCPTCNAKPGNRCVTALGKHLRVLHGSRTASGVAPTTDLGAAVNRLAAIAREIEEGTNGHGDFALSRARAEQVAKDLRRVLRAARG